MAMSQQERDWLDWLKRARDGKMTQREAADRMGVSERWVRHLLRLMKKEGDSVVIHGLRGRNSNRRIPDKTREAALAIVRRPEWHDFGPTFAAEQLGKRHRIEVGKETLRGWMIEAGLWKPGSRQLRDIHCWRPRRSGFGELVQWDTSDHDWLEGRGAVRYLVRLIDDATSWSWGRFVESDATPQNMAVLWEYLEKNGRMVDVYTDRHSMFTTPSARQSAAQKVEKDRLTQIGRGLRELGIGWIAAYSPQAKGRVERSFRTAQDRLVKQLRLARVTTLEDANRFLENEYWPEWNARFARPVEEFPNHHRPLNEHLDLAAILCHVEERVIGNDYTFSFAGRRFQILRAVVEAGMRRQRLRVELRLDGELKARYRGHYLDIAECGARPIPPQPKPGRPIRQDHNAGGRSQWMRGFFNRPSPPLWKSIDG
ncbi:MAG TPA: ISNCY family transposase [Bryobacteraceae bacterium]|nr:ISNCY family transposase [Bryobacteraceae bacterium]